jgi:hypothetical protein
MSFLFARPHASTVAHDFTSCPDVQPPLACICLYEAGPTPIYLRNFDVRMAGPQRPLAGGDLLELLVWVRNRDASGVDPAVALLALGDSLPPGSTRNGIESEVGCSQGLSTCRFYCDDDRSVRATRQAVAGDSLQHR